MASTKIMGGDNGMAKPVLGLAGNHEYSKFRPALVALLDERLYPASWLDEQIENGNFLLLSAGNSAMLLSLKVYPSGVRELHAEAAIGELAAIRDNLTPQAEQFAQAIGCSFASCASREGWERALKSMGYKRYQVTLRKAL